MPDIFDAAIGGNDYGSAKASSLPKCQATVALLSDLPGFIGYRDFVIDQYTGELLKIYEAGAGSAGDVLMDWQWPLHSGQAFGLTGRILVFITGLACPLLYVTGIIGWLQKRRAKSSK